MVRRQVLNTAQCLARFVPFSLESSSFPSAFRTGNETTLKRSEDQNADSVKQSRPAFSFSLFSHRARSVQHKDDSLLLIPVPTKRFGDHYRNNHLAHVRDSQR